MPLSTGQKTQRDRVAGARSAPIREQLLNRWRAAEATRNAATIDRIGGRRELQPAISAARWLLAAYLSSIYVDSAIHKILSPMWISGFGVATPMGLPSMVWMDTGWLARIPALVLRLVGWSVVAFELLFPLLYVWRVTRFFAVAAGIALHVGIACIYPIPAFSGEMIAIYFGLLPDQCYIPLQRLDRLLAGRTPRAPAAARALWPRLTFRGMLVIVALWAGGIALVYAPQFVTNGPVWFILKGARRVSYVATKKELVIIGLASGEDVVDGCVVPQRKAYPVYDDAYAQNVGIIREEHAQI